MAAKWGARRALTGTTSAARRSVQSAVEARAITSRHSSVVGNAGVRKWRRRIIMNESVSCNNAYQPRPGRLATQLDDESERSDSSVIGQKVA